MGYDNDRPARASDAMLFEMNRTLGELTNATKTIAEAQRDMWAKINDTHTAVTKLTGGYNAIPVIEETISDHDDRIDTLEAADAKRTIASAKLTTVVGTVGIGLGWVSPKAADWFGEVMKLWGKS